MAQRDPSKIKLAVLGELNAGKTQLVNRFMNGQFDSGSRSTIAFNMHSHGDLELWDLAGNRQSLDVIGWDLLKKFDGIMIVFDLSDCDLDLTRRWMDAARARSPPHTPIALVGNKSDLAKRVIDTALIIQMVKDLEAICYFETSALTGDTDSIETTFNRLAQAAIEERKRRQQTTEERKRRQQTTEERKRRQQTTEERKPIQQTTESTDWNSILKSCVTILGLGATIYSTYKKG